MVTPGTLEKNHTREFIKKNYIWDFRKESHPGFSKKNHTRDFRKKITLKILEKNHTRDFRKKAHTGF